MELVNGFERLLTSRRVVTLSLPWIRIRGRWKLEPKDLRAYIEERKKKGCAA
jgi:hypothetical protein